MESAIPTARATATVEAPTTATSAEFAAAASVKFTAAFVSTSH